MYQATHRRKARTMFPVILGGLALVLGACSSSGSSNPTGPGPSTPQSASTEAGTAAAPTAAASGSDPAIAALIPASIKAKGAIMDVIYNDYPPAMFQKSGKLTGLFPDFAAAAGKLMGIPIKSTPTGDFAGVVPGIQGKRYDVAFADVGVTAARLKQVDILAVIQVPSTFAVKTGSSLKITSASDFCGLTVGALAGSYFINQVQELSKKCTNAGNKAITLKSFPNASAAVLATANGRVDAVAAAGDSLPYTASQKAAGLTLQPFTYQEVPTGVALPKGSPLAPALKAAFVKMYQNGTYAALLKKWNLSVLSAKNVSQIALNPTPPPAS